MNNDQLTTTKRKNVMEKETQCQAVIGHWTNGKEMICLEELNDDDRRWCGKDTKVCRECAFDKKNTKQSAR